MRCSHSIFLSLALFFLTTAAFAGPYSVPSTIPDTGQTQCYDTDGNVISCAGTGQDGEFSINPMRYTTLADGTVKDEVTGLIWEVKENKDDVEDYANPSDADNRYTWYDPTDPDHVGTESTNDTQDFLAALKAKTGHTDWRIPSREELRSLVDYSIEYPGPTISSYFPHTVSSGYWSSTTNAYYTSDAYAWCVDFIGHGSGYSLNKSSSQYGVQSHLVA